MSYVTINDVTNLFRVMSVEEQSKATLLIPVVEDSLRQEAKKVGKDLDMMIQEDIVFLNVVKSVVVDVIGRNLNTSTKAEPMTQMSESALGYTVSGSYLVPGGGLFIKKTELARLGLRRQQMGVVDLC